MQGANIGVLCDITLIICYFFVLFNIYNSLKNIVIQLIVKYIQTKTTPLQKNRTTRVCYQDCAKITKLGYKNEKR